MKDRKLTPDVLGNLMSGLDEIKSRKQPLQVVDDVEMKDDLKEKATFNLPIKLLRELEDHWVMIRKLSSSKRISKTLIVEKALKMAFSDFEMNKKESKFYCNLVRNKGVKEV